MRVLLHFFEQVSLSPLSGKTSIRNTTVSPLRKRARLFFFAAAFLGLLYCAGMFFRWFEHRQVYAPSKELLDRPENHRLQHEEVRLPSGKEELHGWFFPALKPSGTQSQVILFCHGNGGNISHRLEHTALLLSAGFAVFQFDYAGYGASTGTPGEEQTYRDAQAARNWLVQRGFAPEQVLVVGESLGGAIATELAVREKVGGLVLQSTFASLVKIGSELFPFLPVKWMASIRYDTVAKLPRVEVPVLVLHSKGDRLIPFAHAELNFAAARVPKFFREIKGDHNDAIDVAPELYSAAIVEFARTISASTNK
jgi:hypothetical protein